MTAERGEVTDDAILNGRLHLFQPKRGHRFGHDAILLAAATPAKPGERIAELGAGVGAASLALMARVANVDVTLFEIEPVLAALASKNIVRNGYADRARVIITDIEDRNQDLTFSAFDRVLMNPPFNPPSLQASPDPDRRTAHMASHDTLRIWLDTAAHLLQPSGSVTVIWRAEQQTQMLADLARHFGKTKLRPIHPAPDTPAIRIIATGVKGAPQTINTLPGLVLTDADRRPSAEAEAIMRGGMPLAM